MSSSIFSTYRGGENRVTSSMLAVFQRIGVDVTERILGMAMEEDTLALVTFTSQPSAGAPGVPDAELQASFRFLIETKVTANNYRSLKPDAQLGRHLNRLDGSYQAEYLLVITPDAEEPPGIAAMGDPRVVWMSFDLLAQAIGEVLDDRTQPPSEQQAFLLRELLTFLDAERLVGVDNTVIVAGRWAYPEYKRTAAYICQPNRSIRPVAYLGFYTSKQIKPEIARVQRHFREVPVTEEEAVRLEQSDDSVEWRLAEVIRSRTERGHSGVNDVYLLSPPDHPDTVVLSAPIRHEDRGAWTQGQRYTNIERLSSAATTGELV